MALMKTTAWGGASMNTRQPGWWPIERGHRLGTPLALVLLHAACSTTSSAPSTAETVASQPAITIEHILNIKQVSRPSWSLDGQEVAYTTGKGTEIDLWASRTSVPAAAGTARQIAPLADRAQASLSPDWQWIAFVSKQRIWKIPAAGGDVVKLTEAAGKYASLTWSPDSSRVAFVLDQKDQTDVGVVPAAGGATVWIAATPFDEDSPVWSPDSGRLAFIRRADDWASYEIWVSGGDASAPRSIVKETYDRGVEEFGFSERGHWSPDGTRIVYLSNRKGFNHVWTVPVAGGEPTQITRGEFVDYSPSFSPSGDQILFISSRAGDREDRHVWTVPAGGGDPVRLSADGFSASPEWSPDGSRVAYLRSSATEPPEVVVQEARPGAPATRLTESRGDPHATAGFVAPEAVSYPSRDGTQVPAILLRPAGPAGQSRPALVYFHGKGGVNLKGWGGLPNYPFHQYLVQQGYAILFVNWRGTHVGYGNAFEQANYRDYAGGELDDVVAGAQFLQREVGVDPRRIACWGGSYGGYMTMLAITKAPDVFSAGISLYGVSDWVPFLAQNKRRLWTHRLLSKLGDPVKDRALYERAASIRFSAQARSPLLLLTGLDDDGVVPEQALSLFSAMKKAGKFVEYAAYTGEGHGFRHTGSLRDLYTRVEAFLARHNAGRPVSLTN
jgi:dipeptidyl aminopeptidase/acylaminoacyl peptidase